MNKEVKQESENGPGLKDAFFRVSEAFLLVSKELFGSLDDLDWVTVKHKYEEITVAAKEKRELDVYSRAQLSGARDDRESRDRKDRDDRTRTLTWLLANDRAYREAHERAMDGVRGAGKRVDDGIDRLKDMRDANRKAIDSYLLTTARLADGRYVMVDEQGKYWDQNMESVSAQDAAQAVGPIRSSEPYSQRWDLGTRIEERIKQAEGIRVDIGGIEDELTNDKPPASRERLEEAPKEADRKADDVDALVRSMQQEMPDIVRNEQGGLEGKVPSLGAMAMLPP